MAALRPLSDSDFIGNPRGDERHADHHIINHLLLSINWSEYVDPYAVDQDALMSLTAVEAKYNSSDVLANQAELEGPRIRPPDAADSVNMGGLAHIPLEVMHCMIDNMDFLSLARFGQTCRYARMMVESHPTLKILLKHCDHIRKWLWNTQLVLWHSILNVKTELFQPWCRSCGRRGDLYHIPTGERICTNCNENNQRYWSIELKDALQAFNLEMEILDNLPLARVFDRQFYGPHFPLASMDAQWLVPVRVAYDIAVQVYGSVQNMQKAGQACSPDRFGDADAEETKTGNLYRWLRSPAHKTTAFGNTPMRPDGIDYSPFGDRLATSFPYIPHPGAEPEQYFSCKGCRWCVDKCLRLTERQARYMGISPDFDDKQLEKILGLRTKIVRSKEEHIKHLETCLGGALFLWNARVPIEVKNDYRI